MARSNVFSRPLAITIPVIALFGLVAVSAFLVAFDELDPIAVSPGLWYSTIHDSKCRRGVSCNGGNDTTTCKWAQNVLSGDCVWFDGNTSEDFCAAMLNSSCDAGGLKFGNVSCGLKINAECVRDPESPTGAKCQSSNQGTGVTCRRGTCT